jgi:hypothetical protein
LKKSEEKNNNKFDDLNVYKKISVVLFFVFLGFTYGRAQDTISNREVDTLRISHSPSKAALMSAILPGLGQVYNKKVWKVPVLYAGLSVNAIFLVKYAVLFRDYQKGYVDYQNYVGALGTDKPDPLVIKKMLSDVSFVLRYTDIPAALKYYKDQYRRLRDLNILVMSGIYFINIIDATVDAYLFNYDISDKLSLRVDPVMINTAAFHSSVGIKLTFNLH